MSLRLLPAIIMDNDDDDDGNFTKWMSSYWGHGAEGGHSRERKRSFRRPARTQVDRRASLPTVSQLDEMKLTKLHATTAAPATSHIKMREEKGEARCHQRARRTSSDENSRSKASIPENNITTIPELTESFQKRLCLSNKKSVSMKNGDKCCHICNDNICRTGGGNQELPWSHHFHKEVAYRLELCRPRSSSEAVACPLRRFSDERRKSADEPISVERQQHAPHRQLSLRRHR